MAQETKVVMFTDEVNSTARNEDRTDDERTSVAKAQSKLTNTAVRGCRGKILKDTGDGHFMEFRSCADAVKCGHVLQKMVTEHNQAQTNDLLKFDLHVGIDSGDLTVLKNKDLRGTAAARASRISGKCPAGEVYFSSKIAEELNRREARVEEVGKCELYTAS
jgi:class 3 adenylate cyclase